MTGKRAWTLGALSGVLMALAFPPFDLPLLSLVALVPLVTVVQALPERAGLRPIEAGFAFGIAHFGLLMLWIVPALWVDTRWAPAAYGLVVSGAALIPAASMHAACALRRRIPAGLALALAWVAGEWLRAHLGPLSFPWLPLAASLVEHPGLLLPAAWLGESGLTLGIVLVNAAWVPLWLPSLRAAGGAPGRRARLLPPALAVLGLGAVALAGWRVGTRGSDVLGPRLRVATVTTDHPRSSDRNAPGAAERLDALEARLTGLEAIDLMVLPEAFVPTSWRRAPYVERTLRRLSERVGAPIVVGTLAETAGGVHNAVAGVTADAVTFVHKSKRVPWVESGFSPATEARPLRAGSHTLAVLVCFEAAFADLTRRLVRAGGHPIVNVTSDAWFPPEGIGAWGRAQQIAHLPLRAVENGVAVVRVANHGPTLWLDAHGRSRGRVDSVGIAVATLRTGAEDTPYGRTGDLLGVACFLVACLGLARGAVEPKTGLGLY